ncbi:PREDICTED: uncharacterized protein LOC101313081 isoform X2 [Fragaria vesca subsp. vesca]|uniref:uncharacterized protein LOC101313081 isoform X2 n=1 Tax=Fragaria vesca subsp. vesca TaxID=101020 RepID=UPI0002C36062|nr:PREDICTED: uncharacterized protein LOC101313081 isoform X2 [Fragaria vesca subsp. vesca]XP_004290351.1 PREDICTED: uncharacterized protein LOC101313081 isoform X2 [Fragaria vesca subsp. vesca]XP_011458342.1 PREDICTED: uncharacterized protein LOC101313081 isoform X2 [Fragaria vesca subsp. vesca]XP_011458343.1 PREDICTED: uncharacterized protein LOC101313081 isoform X2 [Fragaria vesca subsp. vesca]
MSLLSKAGSLLRQTANRQSIHHSIRCPSSMGTQQALRGPTDQQSVRTACTKSGEVDGKTFMDSDSRRSTGLGFTTSGAILHMEVQDLHSRLIRCEHKVVGLAINDIIGQRRSFSSGATGNAGGGNKPQINSARPKHDRTAASYLPNLSVFSHITSGIEGIMADYVHQKMTKEFFSLCFSLFFLIIMKDLFLFLVFP